MCQFVSACVFATTSPLPEAGELGFRAQSADTGVLCTAEVGGREIPDPSFTAFVSTVFSHVLQVVSNYDL